VDLAKWHHPAASRVKREKGKKSQRAGHPPAVIADAPATATASSDEISEGEHTPHTHPDEFENIRGTSAKKHKSTGEIWVPDKSGHYGGRHFEVYRNRRDYDDGKRDRAVGLNGKLIKKY
jgi:hypothetical protein